jgi:hypothetical protein
LTRVCDEEKGMFCVFFFLKCELRDQKHEEVFYSLNIGSSGEGRGGGRGGEGEGRGGAGGGGRGGVDTPLVALSRHQCWKRGLGATRNMTE